MLAAGEIAKQIRRGEIAWSGELRGDGLLLRLGAPLQPLADPGHVIELADQDSVDALYAEPLDDWGEFDLSSGQMVLCAVGQPLRLGAALAAGIAGLSHLARIGLAVHITSPWVMPGWDGYLTLELHNVGPATLRLRQGMPVARAVIWRVSGDARAPVPHGHYGGSRQLGSRYAVEFGSQITMHRNGG